MSLEDNEDSDEDSDSDDNASDDIKPYEQKNIGYRDKYTNNDINRMSKLLLRTNQGITRIWLGLQKNKKAKNSEPCIRWYR